MKKINDLVDRAMRAFNLSTEQEFAKKLNLTKQNFYHRKGRKWSLDALIVPLAIAEGINLNWLYTGNGPIRLDEAKSDDSSFEWAFKVIRKAFSPESSRSIANAVEVFLMGVSSQLEHNVSPIDNNIRGRLEYLERKCKELEDVLKRAEGDTRYNAGGGM